MAEITKNLPVVEHGHDHDSALHHQFEDLDQQNEAYVVGMWTFLVTEIMFFGALFLIYTLYRWNYMVDFWKAHEHLNVLMGGVNTTILLFSSFTMVLAVHFAQLKDRVKVMGTLAFTVLCACAFLGIKFFEYKDKLAAGLFPGVNFTTSAEHLGGANPNHAQLFYGLYFAMTGLHGVHIIAGILVICSLIFLWGKKAPSVMNDYVPTEMVALYWHFVDLVWIFLFPLFYLMPKPH